MDWFEALTGFRETGYAETRARLAVKGDTLISSVNGAAYGIGTLTLVSLHTLRDQARAAVRPSGRLSLREVTADVRHLPCRPEAAGALFQVASQFNLLEMSGPEVTPEHGVTRYEHDRTQGPACAIAAGAATIYRNYFAPVGHHQGQTAQRQLDGLADLGRALGRATTLAVDDLWTMRNGYALGKPAGLGAIAAHLRVLDPVQIDALRGQLRIGLHRDVEVTDAPGPDRPRVTQAFCSALPIAYCAMPPACWEPFARLVLEAAYEATLWAAVLNARCRGSNIVFLTLLGAGAFGNPGSWSHDALQRALSLMADFDLDVRLVRHGPPSPGPG